MKRAPKHGFTLIEILVAMAITTSIFAMMYAGYRAISKSAGICNERIATLDETRNALAQMARQISCSYPSRKQTETPAAKAILKKEKKIHKNTSALFEGDSNNINGWILNFVTTASGFHSQKETDGLFEVIYRFDKSTGQLSFSQTKFVGSITPLERDRLWLPIGRDITAVDLTFYDGQEWLKKWDVREKLPLPYAVKIDVTVEHANLRPYHYATIAPVYCQMLKNGQNKDEILVSVNCQ